jgi:hypothetical protein
MYDNAHDGDEEGGEEGSVDDDNDQVEEVEYVVIRCEICRFIEGIT